MRLFFILFVAGLLALPAHGGMSLYAGQHNREIKALAPELIRGLRAGAGLGYAKAAELNGWPGPLHVLEMAEALDLTTHQETKIRAIRAAMLAKAKALGNDLIALELALDALFAEGRPDPASVAQASARVGAIEAELRAVHLSAHLETAPLLTRHQRKLYARLRGYAGSLPKHKSH